MTFIYKNYVMNKVKSTAILSIKYGTPILLASSYKYLNTNRNVVAKEEFYNMKLNKEKFYNFYSDFHSDIETVKINPSEKEELIDFFEKNYLDYMLEEKFLNEGLFYGIRKNGKIVGVCGVFSDSKDVIQIGNAITHIDYRRQGFAER